MCIIDRVLEWEWESARVRENVWLRGYVRLWVRMCVHAVGKFSWHLLVETTSCINISIPSQGLTFPMKPTSLSLLHLFTTRIRTSDIPRARSGPSLSWTSCSSRRPCWAKAPPCWPSGTSSSTWPHAPSQGYLKICCFGNAKAWHLVGLDLGLRWLENKEAVTNQTGFNLPWSF